MRFGLQGAEHVFEFGVFGFAQEQVDVLGHEDVPKDVAFVPCPDLLQDGFEDGPGVIVVEIRETPVTAEGDEMVVAFRLEALETTWHISKLPGSEVS